MSVELYDAQAALDKLGKALGVLQENVRVSSGPVVVLRVVYDDGVQDPAAEAASEAD